MLKLVAVLILLLVAVVSAQQGAYDQFFGANYAARDPRNNRGPVLFPTAPDSGETSGVVVGASGYGFVPPGTQSARRPYNAGRHFF